jgi:hypothetical protein
MRRHPMHEIVTAQPQFEAIQEGIARLEAARREWQKRGRIAGKEYQAALAEHREVAKAALLRGEEPPPEPEPPAAGTPEEARLFLGELNRLRNEEKELLAWIAPDVAERARARERELLEAARPHVETLADIRDELGDLVAITRQVLMQRERRIDGITAGTGHSDGMRHRVTITDVATAVTDTMSLLDPPNRRDKT